MASMLLEQFSLLGVAIRSFVLLILTAALAFACRRSSAAFLHGIWTVGLAACLTIPVVMSLSPSWHLALLPPPSVENATRPAARIQELPAVAVVPAPAPTSDVHSTEVTPPTIVPMEAIVASETLQDGQSTQQAPLAESGKRAAGPSLGAVGLSIWGAGFFVVMLRLLQQLTAVRQKLFEASHLANTDWHDQRDVAARLLGVRTDVVLKRNPGAVSPMVVGLFKPVMLLPEDADTWSSEHRHLVLLHELAHVQRRDVLTQAMATLVCAVYWFNPLAWWGARQMKGLREIACDDAVVSHSHAASTYAQTLLDVAKRYRCQPASAVAMARSSDVEGRIAALLSSTRNRTRLTARSMRILTATAMAAAAFVGTCQLISRAEKPTEAAADQTATTGESNGPRTMLVRVLDESGKPLANANLHVSIWELGGAKDYPNRDYTTDEAGRVEIARPQRLMIMRMWSAKDGYVPLFVNFAQGKHEEGRLIPDEYEFHMQKGQRLSGQVVDDQGKPIANAKVQVMVAVDEPAWGVNPDAMISTWLTDSDFNSHVPITDSEGRWSINNAPAPPGKNKTDFEFRLQVTHPEFAGDTRWGELQQKQGITTEDLRTGNATLALDPGIAISGQVTDPDGEPVRKGLVIWSDHPYWAEGINETQIEESGRYKTKRLAPGKYPITVLAPGFAPWQETVDVYREIGNLNIQLGPGHPIRMKFLDQTGTPIPGTSVQIGEWRGTEAIYNHKHPNVPDSGIPRHANDEGVYEWDWAPKDAVTYHVSATGYAEQKVSLVAKPEPHVISLASRRVVVGMVTDASTGKPVESFLAMPVIVFRQDFYHTRTTDAKVGQDGSYELPLTGSADPSDRYRVRLEADGYRSVVSDESFGPLDGQATLDMTLEPAQPRRGRVVDPAGKPVAEATILQASPTDVPRTSNGKPDSYDSRPTSTGAEGDFEVRATTEPVLVRAYHDLGFAEKALAPDEGEVGELKLQSWASVSGRLMQAGRPVADQSIYFSPLVNRGLTEARFQDSYYAKTDADGRFQFDRIPPIAGTLRASLGPWQESPLTSSEAIPLQLNPGEHREIVLGGDGATISGRVVATGRSNDELSKQWSLNYLVSRERGVDYPDEAAPLSFDPTGSLQADGLRKPDFQSWVATRRNYFVKLAGDGQLAIHGVEPGEYDLVIQLYEQPAGCLVETIGETVTPIVVTDEQAESGSLQIGDVEVPCRIGPRVGSDMRAFQFTDASGQIRHVDDMHGKFVLFHVWATWCTPCVTSMPSLTATVEQHSDSPLTVVGLNVDDDRDAAAEMAKTQKMKWAQNYLGPDSDLMRQLAVSSVPAYYLIGPDGKLVRSSNQ